MFLQFVVWVARVGRGVGLWAAKKLQKKQPRRPPITKQNKPNQQPFAELFGARCGVPPAYVLNFGEEAARDRPAFVASLLAAELEARARAAAGAGAWHVVSQPAGAGAGGRVVRAAALTPDVGAGGGAAEPAVVLAEVRCAGFRRQWRALILMPLPAASNGLRAPALAAPSPHLSEQ